MQTRQKLKDLFICFGVIALHGIHSSSAFHTCPLHIKCCLQSHFFQPFGGDPETSHSLTGAPLHYHHGDVIVESDKDPLSEPGDSYFWTHLRSEEEITDYCCMNIFPDIRLEIARDKIHVISTELPLVVIDDLLPDEMCQEIIEASKQDGKMKRSTLGVSQEEMETRTSSTTWLHEVQCEASLRFLAGKVSRLSGIPARYMENLQVVRYEPGQKFDLHTDHLEGFNRLECRGRLATCLLYLNSSWKGKGESDRIDNLFQGGETHFPEYLVSIVPKRGRAVFWFNTIEKPGQIRYEVDKLTVDLKSRHAGKPVTEGEKWVCNQWIHPIPLSNGVRDET